MRSDGKTFHFPRLSSSHEAVSQVTVPPTKYGQEDDHVSFVLVTETGDPCSYREVIEADDHGKWVTTMEQEIESLDRNQIWTLFDLSKDSKVIGCKWIFQKKGNQQYKARLVAKRYDQKESIDYNKIFSHVVKHTSIQWLLAIVTQGGLELEQLDMKTTFLRGGLEERIYMKQPEEFFQEG